MFEAPELTKIIGAQIDRHSYIREWDVSTCQRPRYAKTRSSKRLFESDTYIVSTIAYVSAVFY